MTTFRFHYPISIRYGDLDPQWHVNNARFLTFMEQTRMAYIQHLGLFDGKDFLSLGLIVADIHIAYRAPIQLNEKISVGMRISRLGNKSFLTEYIIKNDESGEVKASAETTMVTFDYRTNRSVTIWQEWREKIAAFEGIPPGPAAA
ncbi:MAG: thioesterase family protein [Chloroflexota bacterium]|jgi:acyl-CoA thioester hydrolase